MKWLIISTILLEVVIFATADVPKEDEFVMAIPKGAELVNEDFVEPKNEEPLGTMSFESGDHDIEVIAE
ncbi:hypothetical protein ACHWQZ_G017018 [Mnemiopsis leidyi]